MGLLSFIREAGEKLFNKAEAKTAITEAQADPAAADKQKAASDAAAEAITTYIHAMNLDATGLLVTFDAREGVVTVYGVAPDQQTKEKIVLCCGNVAGVSKVNDMMSVDQSAEEAKYYTVVSGDTLSKISKQYYGNANQYMKIFDANRPMLTHPDKIYPGQMLRIP
jgi:nucleoid-associated protein YgaU